MRQSGLGCLASPPVDAAVGVAVGLDTAACVAAGPPNLPIPLAGRYYTTTACISLQPPGALVVDRQQRVALPSPFDLIRASRAGNTSASCTMQPAELACRVQLLVHLCARCVRAPVVS